jgi:uncharacterized membrane protein YbaN (DUF454 family)
VRGLFLGLGFISLAVAAIGVVLPLVPITGPTLLAAYFFARSSPRFDRWLTNHRWFGPIVRDWRAGAGFTVRAKVIAAVAISISFLISGLVAVQSVAGRVMLALGALALCAFVVSRPTKRPPVSRIESPR